MSFHDDYYYDERGDFDDDPRTYNQKVHDDNTWRRDAGILEFDGKPYLQWCENCKQVVKVRDIQGSTVFDTYQYIVCHFCGLGEDQLREPTDEELANYDPDAPPNCCMECGISKDAVPAPHNFRLYRASGSGDWLCLDCFLRIENIQTSGPISPEEELRRAALDHKGRP